MGIFGKPPESKPELPALKPSAPVAPGAPPPQSRASIIAPKAVFKGEITGDENLVVEGTVEGQIRVNREVRVAQGGTVRATVQAQSLIVGGEVVGNCTATARIDIQATGRLTGDIRAPRIAIAEGAIFRGRTEMAARGEARVEKAASS